MSHDFFQGFPWGWRLQWSVPNPDLIKSSCLAISCWISWELSIPNSWLIKRTISCYLVTSQYQGRWGNTFPTFSVLWHPKIKTTYLAQKFKLHSFNVLIMFCIIFKRNDVNGDLLMASAKNGLSSICSRNVISAFFDLIWPCMFMSNNSIKVRVQSKIFQHWYSVFRPRNIGW